jgi:FMN reductase
MTLVAVSAGETPTSKTRVLALAALDAGGGGQLIELTDLSAEGLLGRSADRAVEEAVVAAADASILVLASPVYRATVSGALKAFLDRLPTQALEGTAVVLVATAGSPLHYLSLDTSGRALVASLGGWSVPTVVYATGADFQDGVPSSALLDTIARALAEAAAVVGER